MVVLDTMRAPEILRPYVGIARLGPVGHLLHVARRYVNAIFLPSAVEKQQAGSYYQGMDVLDNAARKVKELIPDADYVTVGRMLIRDEFLWVINFTMPFRDRAFRVHKHRMSEVHAHGETIEAAIDAAVLHARYHRTGKFTEE